MSSLDPIIPPDEYFRPRRARELRRKLDRLRAWQTALLAVGAAAWLAWWVYFIACFTPLLPWPPGWKLAGYLALGVISVFAVPVGRVLGEVAEDLLDEVEDLESAHRRWSATGCELTHGWDHPAETQRAQRVAKPG
jgi:hypothetical protein